MESLNANLSQQILFDSNFNKYLPEILEMRVYRVTGIHNQIKMLI